MESNAQEEAFEMTEEAAEDGKAKRDKTECSHRVIEKRRRDRINNSLLQLSKLVPVEQFNKKNSGKLEKAEILEVTVQYLTKQQEEKKVAKEESGSQPQECNGEVEKFDQSSYLQSFSCGFKECIADATKFFQEVEELDISEGRCHRLIQHLKKQLTRYENQEIIPSKAVGDERVWEDEPKKANNTRSSSVQEVPLSTAQPPPVKSESTKRKNDEKEPTASKKMRAETNGNNAQPSADHESSSNCNSELQNVDPSTAMRNFVPFMLPNVPLIPTFPFAGANGMPRYQTPQAQFPGYAFPQSATPYIPVALPQFPYIGMNFMSGFGMVNPANEQQQNTSMANGMPSMIQNGLPNGMVNGISNGFLPSMYSNGIHANFVAMRQRDSGYDSSDRSSSKGSRGENSPQSFSEESCRSFVS